MNEPIIKEPMFPILSANQKAYRKYVKATSEYTTPLPYDKWLHDINNVRVTC